MKKILFIVLLFSILLNVKAEGYLTNILVDGEQIKDFQSDKTEYSLEVDENKESIKIVFVYDTTKYKGSGSPENVSLNPGLNTVKYSLKDASYLEEIANYTIKVTRKDNRSTDNSLASLTIANKKITLTDKNEYTVEVDNSLTKAELKATLNDAKSNFVSGYGERIGNNAIPLNGETTKVEVKVEAENKSIRTYTINIVKKDYKNNDATLKTLKIDKIEVGFKANILEYNLTCKNDINSIVIEAVANDNKATVEYEKNITLNEGLNNITIKVTAEDGTIKEYKLNITREELVPLVENIEIEDVDFTFDDSKKNYKIETDLEKLNIKVTLTNEEAKVDEDGNENLDNNSTITLKVSLNDQEEIYTFKIVKEEQEEIKTLEKEEDNNSFLKKYEMIIGLGVFGIGVLSLLIAIITKTKKSKIM